MKSNVNKTQIPASSINSPPLLANEILEVIVSSFKPSREPTTLSLNIDSETLMGKPLVVSRLFTENPWEKAALAEIYEKLIICHNQSPNNSNNQSPNNSQWAGIWNNKSPNQPPNIFIESGSTCVYVSELLRRLVARELKNLHLFPLRTNNHLTAWLFLNRQLYLDPPLEDDVPALVPYLFAGYLESKYHGIFPFYRNKSKDNTQDERNGYAQLRLSLARADLLLLAASRLSLTFGPLVGSRENAIFKNACYNACVSPIGGSSSKEIHLFITVHKLVAHNPENQNNVSRFKATAPNNHGQKDYAGFHTWKEEYKKILEKRCFSVFDLPYEEDNSSACQYSDERTQRPSPFSNDLIPENFQRLRDGTSAVEMGDGRFRICNYWQELFTKAHLTVKVFVSFKGKMVDSDENFQWIKTEVETAYNTFKSCYIDVKLQPIGTLKPRGSSDDFSLALITISPKLKA
jgi:hypothetical protein